MTPQTTAMHFTEGTPVVSADGNDLGKVDRLVVDPRTNQVTHLVLSKGLFFPEERVVPVEFVAAANEQMVSLNALVELDDLPLFEETHYLALDGDTTKRHFPESSVAPLVWGHPAYGATAPELAFSRYTAVPQMIPRVDRNIPDDTVAMVTGATVTTSDDEDVGSVAGVTVTDVGVLVSLDIDPGWFKDTRTIPAHFVASIDERLVRLSVTSMTLETWRN